MARLVFPLLAWLLAVPPPAAAAGGPRARDDFWSRAWVDLARLESLEADGSEAQGAEAAALADALAARLSERAAAQVPGEVGPGAAAGRAREDFRARVLAAHLARRRGEHARVVAAGAPERFDPEEAWAAARVLAPGPTRARAFVRALDGSRGGAGHLARQTAAHGAFLEDLEARRGAAARILASGMHADAGAVWSGFCLEGIARRLGEYELADATLAALAGRTSGAPEAHELLARRAIVALGAGWPERARDHLGAAWARAGRDAGQMLGRLALSEGRPDRARRVFRTLLGPGPTGTAPETPWALRGWGLSQLPPSTIPVRRRTDGGNPLRDED